MQEDYPTSAVYFWKCRVVLLRSFTSALLLYFFLGPSLLQMKFYRNCFLPSKHRFYLYLRQNNFWSTTEVTLSAPLLLPHKSAHRNYQEPLHTNLYIYIFNC